MTEPQPGPATAGGLLRAAREKQGLHIAALAAAIKVSPRKLDALENDRHDELPDATFVRALAQTVCRTLKVDAKPVLELLPPAPAVALEPGRGGLGTPFRDKPGRIEPGLSLAAVRPLIWAAGLLLLAALLVYAMPNGWWERFTTEDRAPAQAASVPQALPAAALAVVPVIASAPAATASAAAAASAPLIETVFAAPPVDVSASGAAAVAAGLLQLRTSEPAWVEVRDGRGQPLLSRTVQAGESVGLDGSLPLRLVIGNAAAAQLVFRGRAVDLTPSTRENVARLELQ